MPERRRIDRVLDASFIEHLDDETLDELRERRQLAHDVENELSYYRRLLHGRMDLIAFEQRRRSGEEKRSLIDALPEILSDAAPPESGVGRTRPLVADVPLLPAVGRREIDHLLGDDLLVRLDEVDHDELAASLEMLVEAESEISALRRRVQAVEDALSSAVAERYRSGHTIGS